MSRSILKTSVVEALAKRIEAVLERNKGVRELKTTSQLRTLSNAAESGYKIKISPAAFKELGQQFQRFQEDVELKTVTQELFVNNSESLFNGFKSYIESYIAENKTSYKLEDDDQTSGSIISNINHSQASELFKRFMRKSEFAVSLRNQGVDVEKILKAIQVGHLAGIFNARLAEVFGAETDQGNSNSTSLIFTTTGDEVFDKNFSDIMNFLADADYISNVFLTTPEISYSAQKDVLGPNGPSATVTYQLGLINEQFGLALKQLSYELSTAVSNIRKTVQTQDNKTRDIVGNNDALFKFIDELQQITNQVRRTADILKAEAAKYNNSLDSIISGILGRADVIEKLIGTPGSTSIDDSIEVAIDSALKRKPKARREITVIPKTKLDSKNKSKPSRPAVPTVKKAKPVKVNTSFRDNKGRFVSVTGLQQLINSLLHEKLRENMGTGNSKNILNYRTGRFARSAKVEKISQGRENALTIFYSYMKYPYQTFEPGYKQGSPASRDPKLLISRSIREIAAAKVASKLRAVRL